MTNAPTTRETADHAELARLAEDASSGPWSVDADDTGRTIVVSPVEIVARDTRHNSEFIAAANPATVLALLSEIAALRGDLTETRVAADLLVSSVRADLRQAERQRDELRKALEPFAKAAGKLDGLWSEDDWRWNDSVRSGVTVRDIRRASKALANQGADQ